MINHFTEKKLSNWGSMPSLHRWSKCRQPILVSVSNVMTPMINLYEKGYCGGWLRYFLLISVNFEMSFCVFNSFKKISALVGYGKNSSFQVRFLEELKTTKCPFEIPQMVSRILNCFFVIVFFSLWNFLSLFVYFYVWPVRPQKKSYLIC